MWDPDEFQVMPAYSHLLFFSIEIFQLIDKSMECNDGKSTYEILMEIIKKNTIKSFS